MVKNPLSWLLPTRKPPQQKVSMCEKIEHIDETVADISDQLADMQEAARQKPNIMLAMPTQGSIGASTEFEPFEPLEEVSNNEAE